DRDGRLLVQNMPVYDLMIVPKEAKNPDTLAFCRVFNIPVEEFRERIKTAKKYSYVKPSPFLTRLSTKEFAAVQEYLPDFPGFYINARTVRGYTHQSLAHALGYIGEISPGRLAKPEYARYLPGDYLGISGIESEYEDFLMGKRGVKYKMVNVRGIDKGPFKEGEFDTLSIAGQNLVSTIDLKLQQYGEKLMAGKIGSVVAIEPATGEILAYISAPGYDPNLLTGKEMGNNYMALQRDPMKTLFNRPIMATYPPGSIFKLVQALIAMQEGVITHNTGFPCNQNLVKCSHGHEAPTNLRIAIKHSCNPYFYQVFRNLINQGRSRNTFVDSRLGLDKWREHVLTFGFGDKLGIDLPNEKKGIIASSKLYDKYYGENRWKFSNFYSVSIGQGETGTTPLQMANLMAIMANRGFYYTPHIIRSVGENGKPLPEYSKKHYTSVDQKYFEPVLDGMEDVVARGTGIYAKLAHVGITVLGKTGTAENPHGDDHADFVAFAPRNDPKIAIAVYIENAGFGAISSAPLAGLMIEKYLTDTISKPRKAWEDWVMAGQFKPKKKH
ncbi:MAG TPA: penicillin-binding transpeptidase domain-containing protein, partial [Adhaeribacter sp.]|nr:penicillin-binding transpeptidase domain-containing protein [Adhaeribacter sp.]